MSHNRSWCTWPNHRPVTWQILLCYILLGHVSRMLGPLHVMLPPDMLCRPVVSKKLSRDLMSDRSRGTTTALLLVVLLSRDSYPVLSLAARCPWHGQLTLHKDYSALSVLIWWFYHPCLYWELYIFFCLLFNCPLQQATNCQADIICLSGQSVKVIYILWIPLPHGIPHKPPLAQATHASV